MNHNRSKETIGSSGIKPLDYNLHIDTMDPCNPDEQWVYRQLLGIALWIVV
jgi:hypothetical protein